MCFIELYSLLPNTDNCFKIYCKSNNNIVGSLFINNSTIELDIESDIEDSSNKKGKIIGNVNNAIALNLNCQQKYIIENFDITPSGTIVTSTNTNNKSVLYNFISYYLFKTKIIDAIFGNL